MAQINIGSIKFKWQGAYAGGTAYTVDDVVSYNGSSYICIQASTGNLPTNATYFEQMSSAGTNGADGTDFGTILTTQGDIVYRDGSGIQRLGAGTSGQFLKTQGTGANPTWGTVTTKLVGQTMTVYQTALNLGNCYRSATEVTGLTTTYTPQSTTSYFNVKCHLYGVGQDNHMRGTLQWSTDSGSTWNSDWSNTRSGEALGWSNDSLYAYPHFGWYYSTPLDDNYFSVATANIKYAPTTPHSITDFRVRAMVFNNDATSNCYINRTRSNTGNHGNVAASSVEITEYEE